MTLAVLIMTLMVATAAWAAPRPPDKLAMHPQPRPVPEIVFTDDTGERMTLADFRGKVVVLNIWATWCPPCRREMPTLDRLEAELSGDRFAVVALSVDQSGREVVREFFEEEGIDQLGLYIDTSARVLADLRIRGIPTTLILDAEGREIARVSGEADWAEPAMMKYFRGLVAATRQENEA
jgi:thiol-disulfide isomerase/thioredoxin